MCSPMTTCSYKVCLKARTMSHQTGCRLFALFDLNVNRISVAKGARCTYHIGQAQGCFSWAHLCVTNYPVKAWNTSAAFYWFTLFCRLLDTVVRLCSDSNQCQQRAGACCCNPIGRNWVHQLCAQQRQRQRPPSWTRGGLQPRPQGGLPSDGELDAAESMLWAEGEASSLHVQRHQRRRRAPQGQRRQQHSVRVFQCQQRRCWATVAGQHKCLPTGMVTVFHLPQQHKASSDCLLLIAVRAEMEKRISSCSAVQLCCLQRPHSCKQLPCCCSFRCSRYACRLVSFIISVTAV